KLLRAVIGRPLPVLFGAVVALAVGAALIPAVGISLVPELSQGELVVELEAAPGTSLSSMEGFAREAESRALALDGVVEVFTNVGVRGGAGTLGRTGELERHAATLLVRLGESERSEDEVSAELTDRLSSLPGLLVRVDRPRLFTVNAPIEVEVRGYNLALLNEVAGDVRSTLRPIPGIEGAGEERRAGTPQISGLFNREQLAVRGLTVGAGAQALRGRARGAQATEFTERDRDLTVLVRAREDQRSTLQDLSTLRIEAPGGGSVSLGAVATLGFQEGPAEIVRRGGSRVALVEAQPT